MQNVIAIIAAYNEEDTIGITIETLQQNTAVTGIVVIDDGSTDDTARVAKEAGGIVYCLPKNGGKGNALKFGMEQIDTDDDDIILLIDADLKESAAEAQKLIEPVMNDEADYTIAKFAKSKSGGGFGIVKSYARWLGSLFGAPKLSAPLSGQRAAKYSVMKQMVFANNYGCELSQNIVLGSIEGIRVMEVDTEMVNRATGRTFKGFVHRGKQMWSLTGAFIAAAWGRNGEPAILWREIKISRLILWLLAVIGVLAAIIFTEGFSSGLAADIVIAGILLIITGLILATVLSLALKSHKKNFAGKSIPSLGGLVFLPLLIYFQVCGIKNISNYSCGFILLLLSSTGILWMALGLYDDIYGSEKFKGFKGHLTALFRHRKLTSGMLKIIGGAILSIIAAYVLMVVFHGNNPLWILVSAPLIALTANTMNLLDLRPGRALKIWLLLACGIYVLYFIFWLFPFNNLNFGSYCWFGFSHSGIMYVDLLTGIYSGVFIILAALIYSPLDFSARMMLGDTGSNFLGGFLGTIMVAVLEPKYQIIALAIFIAINIFAEFKSLSKTIENNRFLRFLDNLGR